MVIFYMVEAMYHELQLKFNIYGNNMIQDRYISMTC